MKKNIRKPDFIVIGAQKAATTWLWRILDSHPGTDLPTKKEIHFFGGVENYNKGKTWYYNHFIDLDKTKLTGEASTTYLYDHIPYWYNTSNKIEMDYSLPSIPEMITNEIPNVKILVVLRDPVKRAISAYKHYMRHARNFNLDIKVSLKSIATNLPKFRILEYGYYARYLQLWKEYIPSENILILVYEEDIKNCPTHAVKTVYKFLDLEEKFVPTDAISIVHKSWGWTRIFVNYHTTGFLNKATKSKYGKVFDRYDVLARFAINHEDIKFLRSVYLPKHTELESVIGRKITNWKYNR